MNTIFDASALINLVLGGALETVLLLPTRVFMVGPQVLSESLSQMAHIRHALDLGLRELSDEDLSAPLFLDLLREFDLGLGETECLAFATVRGYVVCTDDRKARMMCRRKIGDDRVIGTMRLLKECVGQKLLSSETARLTMEIMKSKGAFLPSLPEDYL